MSDRSARSSLTIYGIALVVVFAIVGLLWLQKTPETQKVTDIEEIQQPEPTPQPEPIQPPQGGTVGQPVLGSVDTVTPVPHADPYGPLGPFGPGGPGGPAGPAGPSGPSGNTPPE